MTTATIPDTTALTEEQSIIVRRAHELAVTCGDDFALAGEELKAIKTYRLRVAGTFDDLIKDAHNSHKRLLARKAEFDGPAATAEGLIKRKMGDYQLAERRRAQAEEDRLRAEARKAEDDRRMAEAEALAAQGETEQAEAVIAAPAPAPVVVVKPDVPKIQGVTFRKVWKFRIVDPSRIPAQYMIPNEKAIGEHGRSMKERASIAGVEFYEESSTAASGY